MTIPHTLFLREKSFDGYGHVTETMRRESADRMQAFIDKLTG